MINWKVFFENSELLAALYDFVEGYLSVSQLRLFCYNDREKREWTKLKKCENESGVRYIEHLAAKAIRRRGTPVNHVTKCALNRPRAFYVN